MRDPAGRCSAGRFGRPVWPASPAGRPGRAPGSILSPLLICHAGPAPAGPGQGVTGPAPEGRPGSFPRGCRPWTPPRAQAPPRTPQPARRGRRIQRDAVGVPRGWGYPLGTPTTWVPPPHPAVPGVSAAPAVASEAAPGLWEAVRGGPVGPALKGRPGPESAGLGAPARVQRRTRGGGPSPAALRHSNELAAGAPAPPLSSTVKSAFGRAPGRALSSILGALLARGARADLLSAVRPLPGPHRVLVRGHPRLCKKERASARALSYKVAPALSPVTWARRPAAARLLVRRPDGPPLSPADGEAAPLRAAPHSLPQRCGKPYLKAKPYL